MSDVVLKVENLYKRYRLGIVNHTALADDLRIAWSKITGQPDPTETYVTANDLVNAKKGEVKAKYVWALQDINLEVKRGEILGIIGKNGAGKSTLLKILSKTTAPTKGNVKIKGRVASLLEVGTGFHPELTGRENIYLNGMILGMKKREIDKKLDEIVDFAGIETFLDTPTKRYSSGMKVRLGFAVAAHLEPDILIVDEVLAVGDAEFQKKAIGKMKEVSSGQGRTVLFVSHNMGSVKKLCGRGVLIKNGNIENNDNIENIIRLYLNHDNIDDINNEFSYQFSWENGIGDDEVRLRSFKIIDSFDKAKQSFETDEDIYIEIVYEVRKSQKGFRNTLHLYGELGEHILTTMDTDSNIGVDEILIPGCFRSLCKIPSNFLNNGVYTIKLDAGIYLQKSIFKKAPPLKFNIISTSNTIVNFSEKRLGLISPIFLWDKCKTEITLNS